MRAAIAIAAFAVAANAIAIPAGEGSTLGNGVDPEHPPVNGGTNLDPAKRPSGTNGPPSGSNGPPSGSNGPPSGSNGPPSGSNGPPSGSNGPPSGSNGPPSGSNGPPSGGNGPHSGGNGPHSGGNGPHSGGNGPHSGGNGPHSGGNGPPSTPYPGHDDDDYTTYTPPTNYHEETKYEPHYPSKGYTPPKDYPKDCAYSSPHPPPPPKNYNYGQTVGYPYPNDYPAKGNYGQSDNHGNDYKPSGYKPPKDCGVYSPRHGQPVTCGQKHKFEWHGFKGKQVKLELVYGKGGDDCKHYTTISDSCDNSGHYEWDVPRDIPPTGGLYGYGLKVTCHDTGDVYYSPQFCFDNKDFYNDYKHPACPEKAPEPVVVPPCNECNPPPPPPAQTAAPVPVAPTPCPTDVAAPAATGNATIPTYESGASGVKQSMSFIAALAALVAFAL